MNFALWLTINIVQTAVNLCCVNCEMSVPSRQNITSIFYGQISLCLNFYRALLYYHYSTA